MSEDESKKSCDIEYATKLAFKRELHAIFQDAHRAAREAYDAEISRIGQKWGLQEAEKIETAVSEPSQTPQSPRMWTDKDGQLLARVLSENSKLTVFPLETLQIKPDATPIKNFLEPRVLEPVKKKYSINYRLETKRGLLYAIVLEGALDEKVTNELKAPILWALEKSVQPKT